MNIKAIILVLTLSAVVITGYLHKDRLWFLYALTEHYTKRQCLENVARYKEISEQITHSLVIDEASGQDYFIAKGWSFQGFFYLALIQNNEGYMLITYREGGEVISKNISIEMAEKILLDRFDGQNLKRLMNDFGETNPHPTCYYVMFNIKDVVKQLAFHNIGVYHKFSDKLNDKQKMIFATMAVILDDQPEINALKPNGKKISIDRYSNDDLREGWDLAISEYKLNVFQEVKISEQ